MTYYSNKRRDQIFIKDYEFLSFAKSVSRVIGENISKNWSGQYSHKILDHAKQSATDVLKTASKSGIQKTAEATGDLIGNKIANNVTKNSTHNKSETDLKTEEKSIERREEYISPQKRQQIIDDLRLM